MTTNVFLGDGQRRALVPEISRILQDSTGATPVYGFAQMLETGDALINTDRISGFVEMYDKREWLLSLSAKKGMTWETDPV
ncbi:MAG: hypothetical protein JXN60_09820, partial [Lentisphaerae bacterium]|nr:hypothetical protein [Lentisphaerota bacterium]